MDDDKLLELRVQGVKEASARARVAFFITIFTCGTILITIYNNYFPWNRIGLDPNLGLVEWPMPQSRPPIRDPAPPAALDGQELANWQKELAAIRSDRRSAAKEARDAYHQRDAHSLSENEGITISLLGIRLSSGDLDVFGSLVLLMTSMYYLLSVRRMSLEVASLFRDAATMPLMARKFVYAGVRQSYVLNTAMDEGLLVGPDSDPLTTTAPRDRALRLLRWLFPRLTFLPAIATFACVASDWYYVLVQMHGAYGSSIWWWTHLSPVYRNQFAIMNLTALFIGCIVIMTNLSTFRFQRDSALNMNGFVINLDSEQPDKAPPQAHLLPAAVQETANSARKA